MKSVYLEWEHDPGPGSLCPVCQAQFAYHLVAYTPKGESVERLECWHDHDLHYRLGVPYVGRRRNPEERDSLTKQLEAQSPQARRA